MASVNQTSSTSASGKIEFAEFHESPLADGRYRVEMSQTIEASAQNVVPRTSFQAAQEFLVEGPQFSLNPQDIDSVFPPSGSLGEHDNVLSHVVLKRSTLPWERTADPVADSGSAPWLALLLFDESEESRFEQKEMLVSDLPADVAHLVGVKQDVAGVQQKVGVLEVDKQLLETIVPARGELRYLAHVRRSIDFSLDASLFKSHLADGPVAQEIRSHFDSLAIKLSSEAKTTFIGDGYFHWQIEDPVSQHCYVVAEDDGQLHFSDAKYAEQAIVICNRLPRKGAVSTVHLVSIEHRYDESGFRFQPDEQKTQLITLKNWRFACSEFFSFTPAKFAIAEAATGEDRLPDEIMDQLKDLEEETDYNLQQLETHIGQSNVGGHKALLTKFFEDNRHSFTGSLMHVDVGQLAAVTTSNEPLQTYEASGLVALRHIVRRGSETLSWYHGPLLPGPGTIAVALPQADELPIQTADELICFDQTSGMFDVSYAAAWELGRLMSLRDKKFSQTLFQWKRHRMQNHHRSTQQQQHAHLPFEHHSENIQIPESVHQWVRRAALLRGIPFCYLVPQENLLPIESIRFFQLDELWINCFLRGAVSIGSMAASNERNISLEEQNIARELNSTSTTPYRNITGFLLRSHIVGWPGLEVEGFAARELDLDSKPSDKLNIIRKEKLSPNVLLCLFSGSDTQTLRTVDFHLKRETLHFGFDPPDGERHEYFKRLRNSSGHHDPSKIIPASGNPFPWSSRSSRAVAIETLANAIVNTIPELGSPLSSAKFALEMVVGVERVRFSSAT